MNDRCDQTLFMCFSSVLVEVKINILPISKLLNICVSFLAISKPNDCVFPYDFRERVQKQNGMKLEIMGTERALLGFMLAKIHKVDPDVLVVCIMV